MKDRSVSRTLSVMSPYRATDYCLSLWGPQSGEEPSFFFTLRVGTTPVYPLFDRHPWCVWRS